MSLDDFVRMLPTGQSKITNLVREGLDKRIDSPMKLKRNGLVEQSN
jgi:hypothetical protein